VSAFSELGLQCDRRGWRLALDGHYPNGRHDEGLRLEILEVRAGRRAGMVELLATVPFDPADPDTAAIAAARVLDSKGLIA